MISNRYVSDVLKFSTADSSVKLNEHIPKVWWAYEYFTCAIPVYTM